tara:strand:+ start:86 stop:355 length:270 start_codon:yes stop_codon:yes gene_type:complete
MNQRITDKQLDSLCEYLNTITNSPQAPWANGRANVGNYHISHAYGGVCLHRHVNMGGGVHSPITHSHVPKRELYNLMHAYIKGLQEVAA